MDMSSIPPTGQEPPPQQSSYAPPPPPPPQPQKKGFNWLACCGITCLVVVIVGALMFWGCYRIAKPFINIGLEMNKVQQEVSATDSQTIRDGATAVDVDAMVATPNVFEKQWIAVEGQITGDVPSSSSYSSSQFNTANTTQYMLGNNVIVMDVSNSPKVGSTGDTIRAYGKIVVWDMSELGPMFGKLMEEEMKKEPELAGRSKMIFVIAKEVELVPASGDEGSQQEQDTPAEGWSN